MPEYLGTRFDPIADGLEELRISMAKAAGERDVIGDPHCRRLSELIVMLRDEAAAEFTDPAERMEGK